MNPEGNGVEKAQELGLHEHRCEIADAGRCGRGVGVRPGPHSVFAGLGVHHRRKIRGLGGRRTGFRQQPAGASPCKLVAALGFRSTALPVDGLLPRFLRRHRSSRPRSETAVGDSRARIGGALQCYASACDGARVFQQKEPAGVLAVPSQQIEVNPGLEA
jgi:hypothetical protein